MQKNPLIVVSIAVACVIVLASFTNVVGVHTAEPANHAIAKAEINQKELLFQTILDIANNKEIQNILQKYDGRESFGWSLQAPEVNPLLMNLGMHGSVLLSPPPILTKAYLELAYTIGTRLLKILDTSRMCSILEQYQVRHQGLQQEIIAVIEKNSGLMNKINELSDVHCDCKKSSTTGWNFPVICVILFPISFVILALYYFSGVLFHYIPNFLQNLFDIIVYLGTTLNCFWAR